MAKVYDPIMCMMVDKSDKAQDAKAKTSLLRFPTISLRNSKQAFVLLASRLSLSLTGA